MCVSTQIKKYGKIWQFIKSDNFFSSDYSFAIEPLLTDCHAIEHFRVNIVFRNAKGRSQQVFWIVKVVQEGEDVTNLNHEIRVYTELLTEIGKFLANKRNQRARYLLNVPDLIYHDRLHCQGSIFFYNPLLCLEANHS